MWKFTWSLLGVSLLIAGCMTEQEKLSKEVKDVRDATNEVREAEIKKAERVNEAVKETAKDAQQDVNEARKDLEKEKEDVREEIKDGPNK